ncbi:hypothetical protein C1H76_1497 [Elsinoe australis]|uniref:Uncharacterized protein n=1 Tax=Elsinoe australis TaxID=40998 RepID=A0A4U7BCN1_9PEZI|nr:hypothetical protein C1H76_1497 [Elsinoe australis]
MAPTTNASNDARDILAKAIFVPLKVDPTVPRQSLTPALQKQQLAENIDKHQQQVRRNIARLSLAAKQPIAAEQTSQQLSAEITFAERQELVRSLESNPRNRLSNPSVSNPQAYAPARDPAFAPFVRTQQLQDAYSTHSARVKDEMLNGKPPTSGAQPPRSYTPAPWATSQPHPALNGGAPNLGSSIFAPKPAPPHRSYSTPLQQGPFTAPTPAANVHNGPQHARNVSTDIDRGGRRQEVDPIYRSRRQSMGDAISRDTADRVEGFFRPGQLPTVPEPDPVERPRTATGSIIDHSRDPRRRRTAGS